MDIQGLIGRSKSTFEGNPNNLICSNLAEPLNPVKPTARLVVEPIWENPIDELEGPLYQEYIKQHPAYKSIYLRDSLIARLTLAIDSLPSNIKLVLRAGHRPLDVQHKLLQALIKTYTAKNPESTPADALEYARTYVSDPAIQLPPHCCGAAVDVDLLDQRSGKLLDFGCPVNTDAQISFIHSTETTKSQHQNRMMLLTAMLKAGFAPCYTEWWHYSYGDTTWAYFYKQPKILYGITEPKL